MERYDNSNTHDVKKKGTVLMKQYKTYGNFQVRLSSGNKQTVNLQTNDGTHSNASLSITLL